jgi:hypothetical protein
MKFSDICRSLKVTNIVNETIDDEFKVGFTFKGENFSAYGKDLKDAEFNFILSHGTRLSYLKSLDALESVIPVATETKEKVSVNENVSEESKFNLSHRSFTPLKKDEICFAIHFKSDPYEADTFRSKHNNIMYFLGSSVDEFSGVPKYNGHTAVVPVSVRGKWIKNGGSRNIIYRGNGFVVTKMDEQGFNAFVTLRDEWERNKKPECLLKFVIFYRGTIVSPKDVPYNGKKLLSVLPDLEDVFNVVNIDHEFRCLDNLTSGLKHEPLTPYLVPEMQLSKMLNLTKRFLLSDGGQRIVLYPVFDKSIDSYNRVKRLANVYHDALKQVLTVMGK